MGTVLNAPVSADGTGEELGVVTGLAGVVADLLTCRPQAGAGVLRICQARDPGDTGDQRLPGRVQLASGVEDLNATVLHGSAGGQSEATLAWVQVMRTDVGRPSSSMRFRT